MLYQLIKIPAKLALIIWCRHLQINKTALLKHDGPILLAANHPNSFLDAILICTIFKHPIYSLTRGDVFKNKRIATLLRALHMLPVYRVSEGAENLGENYHTFNECIEVFKKNGIVLIFSEGGCINEWNLRALKKGTARLALTAWENEIPLQVVPVGINYNSFSSFGKNIQLHFGSPIEKHDVLENNTGTFGTNINKINAAIKLQLEKLVIQIKPADKAMVKKVFEIQIPFTQKILLSIPAVVGYVLHWPLYQPLQKISYKKFSKIDHYDSVLVGLLFLLYPLYLLICTFVICVLLNTYWGLLTLVMLPFTAWSFVALKKQF